MLLGRKISLRDVAAALAFCLTPFVLFGSSGVCAAELILFQSKGCAFCAAWDRDVGKIYDLTDEARTLRLRRVDLDAPRPTDLAQVRNIRYTPTFVVMDKGREAGRILGYTGEDNFWGLLGEIIAGLPREKNN